MNLVFQALVIFAFALPGMIFRSAYNRGTWNYPLGRLGPISDQVPRALIYALVLNAAWATLAHVLHWALPRIILPIDYAAVVAWMSNNFGKDQKAYDDAVASLTRSPLSLFFYFALLYLTAWLLGRGCHSIVRGRRWDRKRKMFRFENDWHYLLRGEVVDFPDEFNPGYAAIGNIRSPIGPGQHRATVVTAIVELKEGSYIYIGFVVSFFFNAGGDLERLILDGVRRRKLDQDSTAPLTTSSVLEPDRFYKIKGHFFVLRMSEVKTIGIDYFTDEDERMMLELITQREEESQSDGGWHQDGGLGG